MPIFNLPNNLTVFRLILIPFFMVFFYLPGQWSTYVTATIFVVAALTDWLDGYLARKLCQETSFGKFLDPVADKLVVVIALVLLTGRYALPSVAVAAAVIIAREIIVSALREWMAALGKSAKVAVSWVGKFKTVLQMVAITVLLISKATSWNERHVFNLGLALLYLAVALTVWSLLQYCHLAFKDLSLDEFK